MTNPFIARSPDVAASYRRQNAARAVGRLGLAVRSAHALLEARTLTWADIRGLAARCAGLLSALALMASATAASTADLGDRQRTVVLVTDAACARQLPAALSEWEADRRAEGWKVLPRILAPADPALLQARLRALRPDHTFLVGDGVPFLKVTADPDGHGARKLAADYDFVRDAGSPPFGAIGRIWFKMQAGPKLDSIALCRRYFSKRHAWKRERQTFGPMVAFDDHLSFRPDGAMWAKAVLDQRPADRIEHIQPPAVDPDGEIARRLTSPRLMEIVFSGGQVYVDPGGLYYFGGAKAWRDADATHRDVGPKIAILGAYGSFLCEMEWNNSFLMSAITTSHTVASFYDFQGVFPFGRMFRGATLGDCGRLAAPRGFYLSNVFGDPTLTVVDSAPGAD